MFAKRVTAIGVLFLTVGVGNSLADTNVGGLICNDTTWTPAGNRYIVTSSIVIGCNACLTIQPGVEVRFNNGLGITVGSNAFGAGCLKAQGTPGLPITFRSNTQPQNPGAWARIYFTDLALDADFDTNDNYLSGSVVQYAIVESAGSGDVAAVTIEASRPYISYVEFRHNRRYGISIAGSGAPPQRIDNCEISYSQGNGALTLSGGTGHRLSANNVHDNVGTYVVQVPATTTLDGNTISNNTANAGVLVSGANCVFDSNIVSGNTGVGAYFSGATSARITENTISGNGGRGLQLISVSSGAVTSNTITENAGGIYLSSSPNCTFASNTITGNTDETGGAILFEASSGCRLSDNEITGNHASQNGTGGVYITSGSTNVSLAGDPVNGVYNRLHDNDGCDLRNNMPFNANGSNDINARYVWWGTCDGNCVQEMICDFFDDATKAFVLFFPFVEPGGDFDWDGDVDLADAGEDVTCLTGPDGSVDCDSLLGYCGVFDFDCDGDVDLQDWGEFQIGFTGD